MALAYYWTGTKWEELSSGGSTPGPAGPAGPAGKDGKDGADGAPGRDGVDGAPGAPGRDGVDGDDGAPGRDGVDGAAGRDGVDGDDGKDGAAGAKGDKGDPGPTVVSADAGNFAKLGTDGHLIVKQSELDDRYVLVAGDTMTGPLVVTAAPGKEADCLTLLTDSGDLLYIGATENPGTLGADVVISTINGGVRSTLITGTAAGQLVLGEDRGERLGRVFVDESRYGSAYYARTQFQLPAGLFVLPDATSSPGISNFFAVAYPTVPVASATSATSVSGFSAICLRNAVAGDAGSMSTNINGIGVRYGHSNTDAAFTGSTVSVCGIQLQGEVRTGTVTNYSDILIATTATGGTITNPRNAILQVDPASRSVFLGRMGIGQYPSATRALDVTGDVQFIGNFTVTTGTTVRFPARTVNSDCLGPLTLAIRNTDTTIALTDASRAILNANTTAGTTTYTLPDNTAAPIPLGSVFRIYDVSRLGTTVLQAAPGVQLFWRTATGTQAGGAAAALTLPGEINFVELIKTGANNWYAFGNTF